MKFYVSVASYFARHQGVRRNFRILAKFLLVLLLLIAVYSTAFHFLMAYEGREYSRITGIYWTLTVMTTLGFGDITFQSDLGRLFSIVVLVTGVIYLLTLLPFTFIKFFYAPWMEEEARHRAPRELPAGTSGHVILTAYDRVTAALIEKLRSYGREYVLIVDDNRKALELYDEGLRVAIGNIDDPETYRRMRIDWAALVAATNSDEINTNIAFTVRELNEHVPVIATADSPYSEDILYMAGSTRVIKLHEMLGRSLAAWTVGGDCHSTVISRFDEFLIAEFSAYGTPLVGKRLAESNIREQFGLSVVGIWERGNFKTPTPQTLIEANSFLVLAGSQKNMDAFDDVYSFYHVCRTSANPVLILGGGRVGQSVAEHLRQRGIQHLIIEKNPRRAAHHEHYVVGDAADIRTLQRAWIENAPAAILTTHHDATNIYLTKYLRSLRPDMRILSRANLERNVSTLHRAGADFVMSYASLGANAIFNFLRNEETLLLAEGLNVFRMKAPKSIVGKRLAESKIREYTGCSVIAVKDGETMTINPSPEWLIKEGSELVIIGSIDGERKLMKN